MGKKKFEPIKYTKNVHVQISHWTTYKQSYLFFYWWAMETEAEKKTPIDCLKYFRILCRHTWYTVTTGHGMAFLSLFCTFLLYYSLHDFGYSLLPLSFKGKSIFAFLRLQFKSLSQSMNAFRHRNFYTSDLSDIYLDNATGKSIFIQTYINATMSVQWSLNKYWL